VLQRLVGWRQSSVLTSATGAKIVNLRASFLTVLLAGALVAGCDDDSTPAGQVVATPTPTPTPTATAAQRTIVFVWDGLRPDDVTQADTPNLYAMRSAGVEFSDNHSTYPTFTMMNGSSFATGSFPKTSGFYGNTFWTPPQGTGNTIPAGI
jgi:hypothetical protein